MTEANFPILLCCDKDRPLTTDALRRQGPFRLKPPFFNRIPTSPDPSLWYRGLRDDQSPFRPAHAMRPSRLGDAQAATPERRQHLALLPP